MEEAGPGAVLAGLGRYGNRNSRALRVERPFHHDVQL